jgi:hypothetical protein
MLFLIGLGLLTTLISGSPRFFLIKESFLTGFFGLVFLGSLLLSRPLSFYLGRQFVSGGDPSRAAWFEGLWQYPSFRSSQRLIALVWGVGLLSEALISLGLVFILPTPTFLVISPLMVMGVTVGLIIWTMSYGRRRGAAARREAEKKQ